jgi:hypothetical protein
MRRCRHFGIAALLLAAACQTSQRSSALPTLAGTDTGYGIEAYRGRVVRVCGRLVQRESRWAVEYVSRPGDTLFHGYPAVLIAGCPHAPRLDRSGCIVGRVAAEDGSLSPPPRQVHDDDPVSRDWLLHAQCRARD